jgi:hypothetical protein
MRVIWSCQEIGRSWIGTMRALLDVNVLLALMDSVNVHHILGPKQITDVYPLALAVKNGGRLVTFDRSVPLRAVRAAEPKHLVMI